jgi:hypothetical protein
MDAGNWLAFGHSMVGESVRSSTLAYPPLVPFLAVVAERVLGTYVGLQTLAFAAASAPAIGAYVLLYAWGLGWRAPVLAAFLAASAGTGEAMAWGGYPQLIGLGILPVFVLSLDRFLRSRSVSAGFLPAILLAAAVATSDLVGPMTVLVGLMYLVGWYVFVRARREGNSIRNVIISITIAVALIVPMLPTYFGLLAGVAANERGRLAANSSSLVLGAFGAATSDLAIFWIAAGLLALLSPIVFIRTREPLALLAIAILLPSLALLSFGGENRFVYFVPLGAVAGVGAWLLHARKRLPKWGLRSVDAALVTCVVIDIFVGTLFFGQQRSYYAVLNPSIVQGLTKLDALSEPGQIAAVSPGPNAWPLGWWIEGAARRPALYAGNPSFLNYADERARNLVANEIFRPENGIDQSRTLAAADGASFMFIDKAWEGYAMWGAAGQGLGRTSIVYENDSVIIVRTHD